MMWHSDPLAKPIQWYEGMLLSPQHFQQSQIYNEQQVRCALEAACPYYWGVQELELEEGIDTGVVSVRRVFAVMPDGLVVDFDSRRDGPLKLDLEALEKSGRQRWRVQLAVPRRGEASASSTARFRRYGSVRGERHRDENNGEVGAEVVRLDPILSLSVDEGPDAYVRLGLVEVEQTDDGSFSRTTYVPPLLRVSTSAAAAGAELGTSLVRLAAKIRSKAVGLAERQKRQGGAGSGDVGRSTKTQIQALMGGLLPFELLAESGRAHPFELYKALGAVSSLVSSLAPSGIPAKLPRYDHDDMGPGFAEVVGKIEDVVDRVQLKFRTVELSRSPTPDDPDRYVLVVPRDWEFAELWLELEARRGRGRQELSEWMAACRIASDPVSLPAGAEGKLQRLRRERTLGARAEPTDTFPYLGVEADEQRALFKLPVDGELVCRGEQLVISCTDASLRDSAPRVVVVYVGTDGPKDVTG